MSKIDELLLCKCLFCSMNCVRHLGIGTTSRGPKLVDINLMVGIWNGIIVYRDGKASKQL